MVRPERQGRRTQIKLGTIIYQYTIIWYDETWSLLEYRNDSPAGGKRCSQGRCGTIAAPVLMG
jgi:hypothetical protein